MKPGRHKERGLSKVVAGVGIIVVLAAVVGVLEAPIAGVTCTTRGTEAVVGTNTVASTVTYTTSSPVTLPETQTVRAFNINPATIPPNMAVSSSANLSAGAQVAIVWSAASAVTVYVLDSSEHESYSGNGAPSQSVANTNASASGKLPFRVPLNDTYYLVIVNPASQSASLYSASGVATFNGDVTSYNTVTTSSVTSVAETSTSTATTTSTYQHMTNIMGGCPG